MVVPVFDNKLEDRILRTLNRLPPFSPTLNRLLATLCKEDVSFAKVSDLIEKDAVLAGNILGLVNSSLYGRQDKVNSVRRAVALLGVNKLRNVALGMSITRMWTKVPVPPHWSMAAFNQHAIAVAMLADLISQHTAIDYPEGAFIAGLLHDVGKLVIVIGMPDSYSEIMRLRGELQRPVQESEIRVLGVTHSDISWRVLRAWNLPETIQRAVLFHHSPGLDASDRDHKHPLSWGVSAADQCANVIGATCPGPPPLGMDLSQDFVKTVGVEAEMPQIMTEFRSDFEAIRSFY